MVYTDYCTCFYDKKEGKVCFYDEMKDRFLEKRTVKSSSEAQLIMQSWVARAPKGIICQIIGDAVENKVLDESVRCTYERCLSCEHANCLTGQAARKGLDTYNGFMKMLEEAEDVGDIIYEDEQSSSNFLGGNVKWQKVW